MAEMGAQIRTDEGRTSEDIKKDFFQTPKECTRALIDWIKEYEMFTGEILDPCCGKGAISNELIKAGYDVTAYDKYLGASGIDFYDEDKHYDTIIMNVPYSHKYLFLQKAFKVADKVITILPNQIINYNMFFRDYMNTPTFVGKILLTPKIFMSENPELKKGGASSYSWFMWDSKHNNEGVSKEWYRNLLDFTKE